MTSPLIQHFQTMARYNRLANERVYAACAELTDKDRRRDRRAFFGSIHGTLNHIMVGDRIWLARFAGEEAASTGLDAILYDGFDELRAARIMEDERIEALAAALNEAFLAVSLTYRNNEGHTFTEPVTPLLAHFFNHQTHHRGQVHDMLCQTEVTPPVLDLHRVINPTPGSTKPSA